MDWDNVRITTKTGEKRIIKAKNFPLFDQDLMISTVQDITVQKQEEERLRLLESVIVNSSDSVLISVPNPESRFSSTIYVNKAFTRMTGYSEDEMIGKPPSILLGEKSGKEEMAMLFESISAVKPCQINIIGYKKNGAEFWSQLSTYPIVNNDGRLTHWVSISRDITQRKYLEEKQKEAIEQQALFVSIVNSSDDAIISKTLDGTITSWNKGAERIFNYTQEEAVGNHISIILPPHLLGEEANIVERIKRNETFEHYETERIKKDGSVINVSLTVSPLKNAEGAIIGVSKVARDITERKRAQDAIKASNERYDLVSRATHDSIWDCNLITGTLTRTGDGMKLLFGYDNDDERCNSVEGWTRLIHPDDLAQIEESYNKVFADANQFYWEAEYRFLKADGEYAYVYDKGYIIRNEKGEAIRVIGAAKNITDLKKSTAELEELNTKLIDKADQLAKSNKELEQFAFVASHDLQEPLRMVTSFLTLIENKYEHALDEKGKKYIHFAVDGAKRMRQIILDLLEFSRVGRTGEKAEYVNLNNLVEEVIVLLGEKIKESNATIEVGVLPSIYASKVSLRQVFQNLVDNALKYSQKVTHAQITISVEDLKTHWQFSIKDNGIGIDNQFFDKIFVIFQRLHGKGEFSGNGLGLAVTKKIVENMGGKIWVDSLRGQGSIFYFTVQKK